jgi:hypothetical protein
MRTHKTLSGIGSIDIDASGLLDDLVVVSESNTKRLKASPLTADSVTSHLNDQSIHLRIENNNACILGDYSTAVIRGDGFASCDLGSYDHPFKDLYAHVVSAIPSQATTTGVASFDFYANMLSPDQLLAPITFSEGGLNVAHGGIGKSFLTASPLLAGRVVVFSDFPNEYPLAVGYPINEENNVRVAIGVTMHNAEADSKITVISYGFITVISGENVQNTIRGTPVYMGIDGTVVLTQQGIQSKIGVLVTSGNFSSNDPIVILVNL